MPTQVRIRTDQELCKYMRNQNLRAIPPRKE
jgi:hypothetical protein